MRLGLDETHRRFYLEVTSGSGEVRMHVYADCGFEPVEGIKRYSMAALNGRVFFSADGRTLYVSAVQSTDNDVITTTVGAETNGGLIFAGTDFGDGVNAVNYPYINDDFGAPVLAAHWASRVFYGGFPERFVTFTTPLTADQRFLMKDLFVNSTTVRLNGQCIAWTDTDDPFSISLANFSQVPTKYPILSLIHI